LNARNLRQDQYHQGRKCHSDTLKINNFKEKKVKFAL